MSSFPDFIIQIIAISVGIGSLITFIYLNFVFPHSKSLRLATIIVAACTFNYLLGIIAYVYVDRIPIFNTFPTVFLYLQLLSALTIFYITLLFIEALGHPKFSVFKILGRILYALLLVVEILQISFFSEILLFSDFLSYIFIIFLWANLLIMETRKPIAKRVQITGLIGLGILIPILILQRYVFPDLSIHIADAGLFLFITISSMVFSVSYLVNHKQDVIQRESTIDLQKEFGLTEREAEVMDLLVKSYSYKEIAFNLGITMPTVKTHTSRIYRKTNSQGKSDLRYLVMKKNGSIIQKSS